MCAWSGGVVCLVWGVVCLVRGGVPGPGGLPQCLVGYHHPPINRMTNRCKNITFTTTLLRPVITALEVIV